MPIETSIIIRTRNESRWLGETLKRLSEQTYKNFEIIIVDSGSTDNTLEIARQFSVIVIEIPPKEFTYPYAINIGIKNANATSFYGILSAHSLPIGNNWLKAGVDALKIDPKACGLYGPLLAMPDGTLMDKLIHNTWYHLEQYRYQNRRFRLLYTYESGALGFTNALIRKNLYATHPIDERYAGGGEDTVWLTHHLANGFHVIKHRDFSVHHSHYLGGIGWYKQWRHWKSNTTPQPFTHLTYRKDGAHTPLMEEN